jgi:hypothetical protein
MDEFALHHVNFITNTACRQNEKKICQHNLISNEGLIQYYRIGVLPDELISSCSVSFSFSIYYVDC